MPPTSKTDLGLMSIKAPNGSMKKITLQMSITGTASTISSYDATFEAWLGVPGASGSSLLKSTAGKVQLPGNNGSPVPITFSFATSIPKQSASATIWFRLAVVTPPTRKVQVWYSSTAFKSSDPCYTAQAYTPGSTTAFVRGLSINVTN